MQNARIDCNKSAQYRCVLINKERIINISKEYINAYDQPRKTKDV